MAALQRSNIFITADKNLLIFDGPPKAFNVYVVSLSPTTVHADTDSFVLKNLGECIWLFDVLNG
jgi:hypothetical protein